MTKFPITGAILAGGKNSRLDREKSLISVGNRYLLGYTLDKLDSCFEEVIIITAKDTIRSLFPHRMIYPDILPIASALSGIHSALVNAKNQSVLIVACDMPKLNVKLINKMVANYQSYKKIDILVPGHSQGMEPLHSIYNKRVVETIEKQACEGNLKISDIFRQCTTKIFSVPDSFIANFFNINSSDDLTAWQNKATNQGLSK